MKCSGTRWNELSLTFGNLRSDTKGKATMTLKAVVESSSSSVRGIVTKTVIDPTKRTSMESTINVKMNSRDTTATPSLHGNTEYAAAKEDSRHATTNFAAAKDNQQPNQAAVAAPRPAAHDADQVKPRVLICTEKSKLSFACRHSSVCLHVCRVRVLLCVRLQVSALLAVF